MQAASIYELIPECVKSSDGFLDCVSLRETRRLKKESWALQNSGVPAESESDQPKVIGPKVLECAGVLQPADS